MTDVLAALITTSLTGAAVLHLAWALGLWIPLRDETALARAVVGSKGISRMPGAVPCAVVAVALAFVASLPWTPNFPFQPWLMAAAAFVFFARGTAAYVPAWRTLVPEPAFAHLDTRLYGPVCLFLGTGLTLLVFLGDAA